MRMRAWENLPRICVFRAQSDCRKRFDSRGEQTLCGRCGVGGDRRFLPRGGAPKNKYLSIERKRRALRDDRGKLLRGGGIVFAKSIPHPVCSRGERPAGRTRGTHFILAGARAWAKRLTLRTQRPAVIRAFRAVWIPRWPSSSRRARSISPARRRKNIVARYDARFRHDGENVPEFLETYRLRRAQAGTESIFPRASYSISKTSVTPGTIST